MKITRTLNTTSATYDLVGLTEKEFNLLWVAYNHYNDYRMRRPDEDSELYKKMKQLQEDRITVV